MNKLEVLEETREYLYNQTIKAQKKGDLVGEAEAEKLITKLTYYIDKDYKEMEEDYKLIVEG